MSSNKNPREQEKEGLRKWYSSVGEVILISLTAMAISGLILLLIWTLNGGLLG